MPSLNPPLTKDDFINSHWQDVVDSSEKKDCFTYSNAFWKKAEEAKEAGNIREQAVFEILAFITGVAIKSTNAKSTEEFFAKTFKDLTDEHLDFFAEIAPEISDPELQARVADILWVRREDYRMAQLAVTDPWVKFAGMFNDDPLFNEFVEDMAAYRRELDTEVADDQITSGENQSA